MRLLLVGLVLALSSSQPLMAQQTDDEPGARYRIAPLDVITIDLPGNHISNVSTVNCDGWIELPLLAVVKAAGLTTAELAAQLNSGYQKHLNNPQVRVELKESYREKPVQITGAVRSPGNFQMREPLSLKAALGLAGGLTEKAYRTVQVTRRECAGQCDSKASPGGCVRTTIYRYDEIRNNESLAVSAGDLVHAVEAQAVFVLGKVYAPQGIFARENLTVMRAIAMAGGVLPNAHVDKARVLRRTADGCLATFEIDLKLIRNWKTEDFPLQGGDVVEVAEKYAGAPIPLQCPGNIAPSRIIR